MSNFTSFKVKNNKNIHVLFILNSQELGLVITGTLPVFNKTKTKDERNGEVQ